MFKGIVWMVQIYIMTRRFFFLGLAFLALGIAYFTTDGLGKLEPF